MTVPPSSSDGRPPFNQGEGEGPRAARLPRANAARRGQPRAQPAAAAAEDEELRNIVAIGQSRFELAGKMPPVQPEVERLSDRGRFGAFAEFAEKPVALALTRSNISVLRGVRTFKGSGRRGQ